MFSCFLEVDLTLTLLSWFPVSKFLVTCCRFKLYIWILYSPSRLHFLPDDRESSSLPWRSQTISGLLLPILSCGQDSHLYHLRFYIWDFRLGTIARIGVWRWTEVDGSCITFCNCYGSPGALTIIFFLALRVKQCWLTYSGLRIQSAQYSGDGWGLALLSFDCWRLLKRYTLWSIELVSEAWEFARIDFDAAEFWTIGLCERL